MSKVEAILSQLKEVAANPKKAMDDFKAETGKGAVGIMPIYAPEEISCCRQLKTSTLNCLNLI